jgi:hypothetical protein
MLIRMASYATALLLIAGLSNQAHADIHKCVAADGSTSFTDQPCPSNVKENAVGSSISGSAHQTEVADSCYRFNERRSRCGAMYSLLDTNFNQSCVNPIIQYKMDHQRAANNRFRSQKENVADAVNNLQTKIAEDYRCESLQKEAWAFLKQNFASKISEHDTKEIDYNLIAVTNRLPHKSDPNVQQTITSTTVIHTVITR